ncbi:telomeric repeat-binding factor 2-interacting protein 1 [Eudromia elegans]
MADAGEAAAGEGPSRALFLWDDGSPMRFYVRPGLAKLRLAPLVLAGGGRLCRVQEPGAVLLAQPGEAAPGGAVSADYVEECVRRNRRLPLDAWRLPPAAPTPAAATPRGRLSFTAAEDAALLRAVRGRRAARAGGTALWKELERRRLTRHSWQAMRDRYLRHLRPAAAERGGGAAGHRDGPAEGGGSALLPRPVAHSRVSPLPAEPRRADAAAEAAAELGIFAAANREFESTESESDASDISEGFPAENREGEPPEETASPLKTGQEALALSTAPLQGEERPISSVHPSSGTVGEAVKTIRHLMEKFRMDLLTVTQALLKNTGEVEATFNFLQTGQRLDGYPVWSREDDLELQKHDKHIRNKLIAKFGAENVAKRIAFRKS